MKKLYIISAAVVIALTGVITGILVTPSPDSEPVVSQIIDKTAEEMTVVASDQDHPVTEEKTVAGKSNPERKAISIPKIAGSDINLNDVTFEEIQAMYPGYLEYIGRSQSETIRTPVSLNDLTTEEIMAMYPGYLEFVRVTQMKNRVANPSDPSFEEMMAMYPGYLEFVKASQTKNRVPNPSDLSFEEMMAMYPGYLEYIRALQTEVN